MGEPTKKSARNARVDAALVSLLELEGPLTPAVTRAHFESHGFELWTINELVAANMRRARQDKGWSQFELAERMQEWSTKPWSNATVSAAERSRESGRTRRFDAGEILTLAWVFDQPLPYFFLPPPTEAPLEPLLMMGDYEDVGGFVSVEVLLTYIDPVQLTKPFVDRMKAASATWTDRGWEPPKRQRKDEPATSASLPESWVNLAQTLRLAAQMIDESLPAQARARAQAASLLKAAEPPQFVRGIRGYDKGQVDHYVARAEQEIATLTAEREQAYAQIKHLAEQVAQLQRDRSEVRADQEGKE